MSKIALKRIVVDVMSLKKDSPENIYIDFDEKNMYKITALIIGPTDTPYEGGFFFFTFTIPNNYPFSPPKVTFDTIDGTVRFNPNLYQRGKVCLSIINTWPGPKWTSVQSIRSILLSIQSLLNYYPLMNEPGYDTLSPDDERIKLYNNIIKYETLRLGVFAMLDNSTHPEFNDIIKNHFINNYKQYEKLVTNFCKLGLDGKKLQSPIYYGCCSIVKQKNLEKNIIKFSKKFVKNANCYK